MEINYEDFVVEATDDQLASVAAYANEAVGIEQKLALLAQIQESLQKRYRHVVEKLLPEQMHTAGIFDFTAADGSKVQLKDEFFANISKERQHDAHAWLRENGHDDLIKNTITVPLTRGQDNTAKSLISQLEQMGLNYTQAESVHASTLKSFVKEQITKGKPLPHDLLGIHVVNRAVIKKGK